MSMNGQFITLILAIVTVVIFYQLFRVLGQRTGNEAPPFDPFALESEEETTAEENVVSLPQHDGRIDFSDIDKLAKAGTALNDGLRAIRKADASFSLKTFKDGASIAYEMVMTAFAEGDEDTLKKLLARDVYSGFSSAIDERQKNGEKIKFSFVGIDHAEIIGASLENGQAKITLRLACEIISATYDRDDKLVDGDPETIVEVKDLWTFGRKIRMSDPNWTLIATQEDNG